MININKSDHFEISLLWHKHLKSINLSISLSLSKLFIVFKQIRHPSVLILMDCHPFDSLRV